MKRWQPLRNRGDTIVEVLIVVAVLGMAFTLASVTANRGLAQSRNAQEHSQALGIITSQMELLRKAVSDQTALPAIPFCMNGTTPTTVLSTCKVNDLYSASISYVPSGAGYYDFRVKWQGQGNLGDQQELMTYRVHQLTPTTNPTFTLSASTPKIQVQVKKINPSPDGAGGHVSGSYLCGSGNTSNKAGTNVSLQQVSPPGPSRSAATGDTSMATFDDLTEGFGYKANITGVPAGYNACSTSSSVITATSGLASTIAMQIYPQCHPVQHRGSDQPIYGPPYYHVVTPVYNGVSYSQGPRLYSPSFPDGYFLPQGDHFLDVPHGIWYQFYSYSNIYKNPQLAWYNTFYLIATPILVGYSYSDWRSDIIGWQPTYYYVNECTP